MNDVPIILHIELGNYPISSWLRNNKYVIFSELIRYGKKMTEHRLDSIQAIMVSNYADNIVFILRRENLKDTMDKAMRFFMSIEEYEKCAEIRDLDILIQNLENETKNTKIGKSNKRQPKINR